MPDDDAAAVILAITVGARHKISDQQWRHYAVTGTSHLMAISGLHIGLAATGGFLLGWFFLALFIRSGNLHDQAALVGFLVAILYCAVSGFALPAKRALMMLALVLVTSLFRRQLAPARVLSLTCIVMTIADPLAILAPGFQLSFAAVAILFWWATLYQGLEVNTDSQWLRRTFSRLLPLQLALFLGLLPLTILHFGRVAWMAPIANLLVIPVFNLISVPTALLGLILAGPFEALGNGLIKIAWYSVNILLRLIEVAADAPFAERRTANMDGIALLTLWLSALWVLLPTSWPGRKLAWIAAVWTLSYSQPRPPIGCVDIHALDVGQGLATVVITNDHSLVFDTGPSFRSGSDTGSLVVAPFLAGKGIRDIDLVVVSHSDNDHARGIQSLAAATNIERLISGEILPNLAIPQAYCVAGQSWRWDKVDVTLLHPETGTIRDGNNASCVVEIRSGKHAALLTGDIERAVETKLVREALLSSADIVFVPHHGSRTSSHAAFVSALRPSIAVVSAGFNNRWGFPKDDVVARWQKAGAQVVNTATAGAISYRLCEESGLTQLGTNRRINRRIWHD